MDACRLDHLVIAAASLEEGSRWLADRLGVELGGGGRHSNMGTHNRLLRLGDRLYLELIAVDPEAPAPAGRRWFDLDDASMGRRIATQPRLVAWVARTDDLDDMVRRSPVALGTIRSMARGEFRWRIAVRDDGSLPEGGAVPLLIQWEGGGHPADRLPNRGCALLRLEVRHPSPSKAGEALAALGLREVVELRPAGAGEPVCLTATLLTPDGPVCLG